MTGTWKGFGTKFYGRKEQYPDGSFITTEWFVVFFFPIIPINSYRVIYLGMSRGWGSTTSRYHIIEKLGVNWGQVFFLYFLAIATTAIAVLIGRFLGDLFNEFAWGPFIAIFGAIIPIVISINLFFMAKPKP